MLLLFSYVWFFCDPMGCSPPGSSVHGISQARILQWVSISFFLKGIFLTQGSNLHLLHLQAILYHWSTREASSEENGNPLQYFCLGNPIDRGAWWATVHGVAKSKTWLNNRLCQFKSKHRKHFIATSTPQRLDLWFMMEYFLDYESFYPAT